jgi:hypothetical protein
VATECETFIVVFEAPLDGPIEFGDAVVGNQLIAIPGIKPFPKAMSSGFSRNQCPF